jgi:hypothetical protein
MGSPQMATLIVPQMEEQRPDPSVIESPGGRILSEMGMFQ